MSVTSASPVAGKGDAGIGALNVTVPVSAAPPLTFVELTVNDVSRGPSGRSASLYEAFCVLAASIVTSKAKGTADVVIGNDADVAPAGTMTLAGTDAYCG